MHTYKPAKQQVIVTDNDVIGQNIELQPLKAQNDDANNNGQQQGVATSGH